MADAGHGTGRPGAGRRRGVATVGQVLAPTGARPADFPHDDDLDVADVAARLGVRARTVRRWALAGDLPGRQLSGGAWLFDPLDVADAERRLSGGTRPGVARRRVDQASRAPRRAG